MSALLLNASDVDALPAGMLPARRNAHARQLAGASWLLRRKADGRYVGSLSTAGGRHWLRPLDDQAERLQHGIDELLAMLGLRRESSLRRTTPCALQKIGARQHSLPSTSSMLQPLLRMLDALGVDPVDYRSRTGLPLLLEPRLLSPAGRDRYGRLLWLTAPAASGWLAMQCSAAQDGITIEAISGFRSAAYQLGIFRRKLARGIPIEQILQVNAAPGFSEHHTGCALDIGTAGEPPAEQSFERTAAFAWLQANAAGFGFRMSYPRDNPHGIVYEPWHWCFVGPPAG